MVNQSRRPGERHILRRHHPEVPIPALICTLSVVGAKRPRDTNTLRRKGPRRILQLNETVMIHISTASKTDVWETHPIRQFVIRPGYWRWREEGYDNKEEV